MNTESALAELCQRLGVETEYVDNAGIRRGSPRSTLIAVLATLGYPAETTTEAVASIERFDRQAAARLIEPAIVHRDNEGTYSITVTRPASSGAERLRWHLEPETGDVVSGETRFDDLPLLDGFATSGCLHERRRLDLPAPVALGYHRLRIAAATAADEGALIVAPRRAYRPPMLDDGRGLWGLAVQLYGLRSARNWGIGDFADLTAFLPPAVNAGAAAVSLNPLHALFPDDPEAASPYSPSSRIFLNPLYLDVDAIADLPECPDAGKLIASPEWQTSLGALRTGELVAYGDVAGRKMRVLRELFRSFCARHLSAADDRAQDFRAFQARGGTALRRFAVFHALREALAEAGREWRSWRLWPDEFATPTSPAVARFSAENGPRIEFHEYLQWQADRQLAACGALAKRLGMPIGLYHDLAVGVDANGAEAWASQDAIVTGWSVGAPPDPWNTKGQSWGLPPFNPIALRALAYRPLADTLAANTRHAGALRIDHILGFRRMFWIPTGAAPTDGVYVRNPVDDMLGVLKLESHRNRCLLIGEDLGTVPSGFRETLMDEGILSYRLLYFERDQDGGFQEPDHYPREALAAIGTHDLPSFPAFWSASDIALRSRLGFYADDDQRRHEEAKRRDDRMRLWRALRAAGLLDSDDPEAMEAPPVDAVYRFLARAPSRLLMAHLEDALGIREQINVPGTVLEHPNWRRRLPLAIDEMFSDPAVRRLLQTLAAERPPGGKPPAR